MDCLVYLGRLLSGDHTIKEIVSMLQRGLDTSDQERGCALDLVSPWPEPNGCYTLPRMFEIVAAINRLRTLQTRNS